MICRTCSAGAAVLRESIELNLIGEEFTFVDKTTAQFVVETKVLLQDAGNLLHTYCEGCDCQHKSPIKMVEYNQLAGLD